MTPEARRLLPSEYQRHLLRYDAAASSGFMHNMTRDLHMFCIWESARHRTDEILNAISAELNIIASAEIEWTRSRSDENFNRLYGRDLRQTYSKSNDVGSGPFLYVVAEDTNPGYVFWRNVSGKVELTNPNVARAKQSARLSAMTDFPYSVHSSNSAAEFYRDSALILGALRFRALLDEVETGSAELDRVSSDLAGSDGWSSFGELADHLSLCCEYSFLRGDISDDRDREGDLDFLTRNCLDFAAVIGARRRNLDQSSGHFFAEVSGIRTHFDLRECGDNEIDPRWQEHMLITSSRQATEFLEPQLEDSYFYLLFHIALQKKRASQLRLDQLETMRAKTGAPDEFQIDDTNREHAIRLISGWLRGRGFVITTPQWPRNNLVVRRRRLRSWGAPLSRRSSRVLAVNPLRSIRPLLGQISFLKKPVRLGRKLLLKLR